MLPQSPFDQHLHDVVKYYMDETMTTLVMLQAMNKHPFNLHLGTTNITNHLQRPTKTTTSPTTVLTINIPPKSGNPGINGRTSQKPPTTLIPQDGLTIQSCHTSINRTKILLPRLLPNLLRHSHPNTLHMATAITSVDLAPSNPGPPPSLQDTLPSISKKAPKRNGPDMYVMLCTTQTECVQRTSWRAMNVQNHPRPSSMLNMMKPWNRSTRWTRESHRT